jgi:hypothetical protein
MRFVSLPYIPQSVPNILQNVPNPRLYSLKLQLRCHSVLAHQVLPHPRGQEVPQIGQGAHLHQFLRVLCFRAHVWQ